MPGERASGPAAAHASIRSMAQCMAMGQAAGTAAALATATDVLPRDLRLDALRDRLLADGAILEIGVEVPAAQESTA